MKHIPAALVSARAELHSCGSGIGAVVTAADYRALGVVRSLGRKGIPVWVLKGRQHLLASFSRYSSRSLVWPVEDEPSRVEFLVKLASEQGLQGWVLFPTDDEMVGLVARHYEPLSKHFRLTTPPKEQYDPMCNKWLLYQFAAKLKLDQPWTLCPRDAEQLATLPCSFPLIIKPALREVTNRLTSEKAWQVDDHRSLLARYEEACRVLPCDEVLIQEVVPGGADSQFSYAAVCSEGRPLAAVVAKRIRQYPMDYGRFSTAVETVDEPGVVEPSLRLLAALGYTGLIEIEFKRDCRDGRFKVIDLNPRVWGWHTIGSRLGLDFAYFQWLMSCGKSIPQMHAASGLHWVRMNPDWLVVLLEVLRGRLSLSQYLRSLHPPLETPIFAFDDLAPGLLELPSMAYLFCTKLKRRRQTGRQARLPQASCVALCK
jgi:predicted ATP-grasp superfamily ATP-dependent carboligase